MKVYLLNPTVNEDFSISRIGRCVTKVKADYLYPPTELLYIASYLREYGHEVHVIDGALLSSFEEMVSHIKDADFFISMVGIFSFGIDSKFLIKLKNKFPKTKIIVFGQGASFITKDYLDYANFVVFGEPEKSILEIISGRKKINAVSYKKGKKISINKIPNMIESLDDLPFPARDLIDNSRYRHALMRPYAMVYSARGCPYQCIFCTTKGYSPTYRVRSVKNVLDELTDLYNKFKVRNFGFMDETFTLNKQRIIAICKGIIKRKLKMNWIALGRVDRIDEDILKWMKKAGCKIIMYGIESFNQEVLNYLRKGYTIKDIYLAIRLTKKIGIETHGFFIFGSPTDDKGKIKDTIKKAKKIGLDYASFNIYVPYPGTESFNLLKSKYKIITKDWSKYDQSLNILVFKHNNLKEEEIKELIKQAYKEFYFRPLFIAHRIFHDLINPNRLLRNITNSKALLTNYFSK